MMPEKKRMLIVGLIAMISLVAIILVVYLITRIARSTSTNTPLLQSDAYPSEVVYLGIYYDEENKHDIIYPLNESLERLDYSLNSFYSIKDYTVINNRLVIYSDTVNEIGYNKEENRFFLNEINPYFNQNELIKLTDEYLLLIEDGKIIARPYTSNTDELDQVITENLINDYVETFGNIVYFTTSKGIEGYDLTNNASEVIVAVSEEENFNPVLKDARETVFLYESNGEDWIYSTLAQQSLKLADHIRLSYNNFYLYDDGMVYYVPESNYFMSENISRNSLNGFFPLTNTINKIYHIAGSYLYMEQTTPENELLYIIYDANKMNTVTTLEYPYSKIIRVIP